MKNLFIALAAISMVSCGMKEREASYEVVPLPLEISVTGDAPFRLDKSTEITYPENDTLLRRNAEFLSEYVAQSTGYRPSVRAAASGDTQKRNITLTLCDTISHPEGYNISVSSEGISVSGQTPNGVFYGVQTIRKSVPATARGEAILFPAGHINDRPRFAYRGMHLDVCRHFFPVEFVKRYIDLLALHNINTFHWHLTEDQGWRIQMDKYPRLTEIGAYRDSTVAGYAGSGKFEHERYGGYYTKEELRDVVKYAAERYINIIPEIDMPGHMLAALASYPELGCTGGPYGVCSDWGVFPDVLCIGNDSTMKFLEDVFSELIDVFPSKYIHIGGDEVPRERWENCPKCQARIKAEGLRGDKDHSAETRLQNYCTNRIERFLNSRGRQIIGWDEILEGNLNPEAIVMSGNSYEGGVKAAKLNHKVVMAPNTSYYFDYYQTPDIDGEPLSIGGCITVEDVYNSDPTSELNEKQAANVWGIQANMWTEYVKTPEHVEYMVLPRMAALAEVQWGAKGRKDFGAFTKRLVGMMEMYEREGYNFARHIYNIKYDFAVDTTRQAVVATMSTIDNAPIYYTLDGSDPTEKSSPYTGPVAIRETCEFKAVAVRPSGKSKIVEKSFRFNKATLKPVTLTGSQPYRKYAYKGCATLVDGKSGTDNFATGEWLGFVDDKDFEALIDLGKPTVIGKAGATALTYLDAWIMAPTMVSVEVSDDAKTFREVARREYPVETDPKKHCIVDYAMRFSPVTARYVRVSMRRSPALPEGHASVGQPPFLFVDEITVE